MYLSKCFTLVVLSVVGAVRSLDSSLVAYDMSGLISASHKSLPTIARYFLCSFLSSGSNWTLETVLDPVVGDGLDVSMPYSFNMSVTYAVDIDTSMLLPLCLSVRPRKFTEVWGFSSPSTFSSTSCDNLSVNSFVLSGVPQTSKSST